MHATLGPGRRSARVRPEKTRMSRRLAVVYEHTFSRSLDLSSGGGVPRKERRVFTSPLPEASADALEEMSATVG